MTDTPKRIYAWAVPPTSNLVGTWCATRYPDAAEAYILAAEHDRMMAEKGAEIAMLRAERDRWHADANLMLGFADLAYDVGACPTSSELIAARDRVVATIRNAAFEDAARMVDCACECRDAVLAAKTKVERWNACGRDPCGALDAAAIRAMKGEWPLTSRAPSRDRSGACRARPQEA